MAEYIEREAAVESFMGEFPDAHYPSWYAEKLKELPTADVAEVVHCVDCEYLMFSDMYGECRKAHLGIVSPHDFCSRGQRRRKGG